MTRLLEANQGKRREEIFSVNLTFETGATYEGQFENNTFHGYGKLTSNDGYIFEGMQENG